MTAISPPTVLIPKFKIDYAGLHLPRIDGLLTFVEEKLVSICKTLYWKTMEPDYFLDKTVMDTLARIKDYSVTYVAEIEAAYEAEN